MDCDIDGDIDVEADAELDIESEMVSPEKKVVFLLSLKLRFELPQSRQTKNGSETYTICDDPRSLVYVNRGVHHCKALFTTVVLLIITR